MSMATVLFTLFLASLETIWTVWPDKCQNGLMDFLGWGPPAQAAKTRVRSIFPRLHSLMFCDYATWEAGRTTNGQRRT